MLAFLFLSFTQVRGLAAYSAEVVRGGVEPPTFRFSGGRSYQLSYLTIRGLTVPPLFPSGPDGI